MEGWRYTTSGAGPVLSGPQTTSKPSFTFLKQFPPHQLTEKRGAELYELLPVDIKYFCRYSSKENVENPIEINGKKTVSFLDNNKQFQNELKHQEDKVRRSQMEMKKIGGTEEFEHLKSPAESNLLREKDKEEICDQKLQNIKVEFEKLQLELEEKNKEVNHLNHLIEEAEDVLMEREREISWLNESILEIKQRYEVNITA